MAHPLMPKATAVWLIDNTTLTFKQISDFCGLHELEDLQQVRSTRASSSLLEQWLIGFCWCST